LPNLPKSRLIGPTFSLPITGTSARQADEDSGGQATNSQSYRPRSKQLKHLVQLLPNHREWVAPSEFMQEYASPLKKQCHGRNSGFVRLVCQPGLNLRQRR
jgi:hypothetical protein